MKKFLSILLIIATIILATSCGSSNEYSRNPDFSYGTYQDNIGTVYELTGDVSQYSVEDYSKGVEYGSQGSYFVEVSETTSGGVVAYSGGIYVYSSDKEDKTAVKSALISELMNKINSK